MVMFYFAYFGNLTISNRKMGIVGVDPNNNKLDHVSFNRDECQTFIHVIHKDCRNRLKQRKVFKKCVSKKLMPGAWHPKGWWNWCMSKDRTKTRRVKFY